MRKLRRKDRAIGEIEAFKILSEGEYGVLSTVDESGQPYGVPLNYVYLDGSIYFHAAREGHKIANITCSSQVSFCVVGKTRIIADQFTSLYESAIIFGRAGIVDRAEKEKALINLVEKYSSEYLEDGKKAIAQSLGSVAVIKIIIEHITGKAHR